MEDLPKRPPLGGAEAVGWNSSTPQLDRATREAGARHRITRGAWADDMFLIAKDQVEAQEVTRGCGGDFASEGVACVCGSGEGLVGRGTCSYSGQRPSPPQNQPGFRIIGLHVGAKDCDIHITAAWRVFRSLRKVFTPKPLLP